MPVRENLVNGAVALLQSAEVQYAPQEQKIAFLKAKNLTAEEIDLAFQRASMTPAQPYADDAQRYTSRPPPYANYQYPPYQYAHPPPPPPELPRRDWRDWFIMATVIGGVGYAAATLAKRYVLPLIAPPTPPQLEQDKSAIDASFDKTFALLDQVVADTEKLKESEQQRTERLDAALSEVESVLADLKTSSAARQKENAALSRSVQDLQDLVPKAIQTHGDATEARLKDLSAEVRSLKALLGSRGGGSVTKPSESVASAYTTTTGNDNINNSNNGNNTAYANGITPKPSIDNFRASETGSNAGSPYARMMNGRATIPAWQMAASSPAADKGPEVKPQAVTTSG